MGWTEEMIYEDVDREMRYKRSVMRETEAIHEIAKALDKLSQHYENPRMMDGAVRRIVTWLLQRYPSAFEAPGVAAAPATKEA